MDRGVATIVLRTALVLVVAGAAAASVSWVRGPSPAQALVFWWVCFLMLPAKVREVLCDAGNRPLQGAWGKTVLISVLGVLALLATWIVLPVWANGVSWHRMYRVYWTEVCWPVLLAEQGLVLVITGGLLTWVARSERRRRAEVG